MTQTAKIHPIAKVIVVLILLFLAIVALFPFFALLLASFKPSTELLRYGLNLKLQAHLLSFKNYIYLFQEGAKYLAWYKNSLIITAVGTVLSLLFSSMVGYALAVYDFKGRNAIFILVLTVMMIPIEILMLPLYKLMVSFKMINTYWGVIVPTMVAPIAIFFFRQYALGLPKELLDAARIDGCSEFRIFFSIMVPLMKPAFGAMAILQAMGYWNSFLWPTVILRTEDMFTLPIGLSGLLTPYGNNYDILISGSLLTILPIIVLFMFFQRYFISGLTVGGVKG
ncbi:MULTISPECIES: carbohydrate ABC transporter permease [Geobacillus]|uniref:L-arabinose transport system (Permease) n=3 Tax=Geobacillus TaxID=129337 RepID=A4IP98_GEOTN|nr:MULTISPECIES: carbohydrate ABC transporter permease [Geobacillus]ABO67152.1 L-arabinose transport system (permease) [Geobacillus thermodenitrificans NG80-2]ARA99615.1 arabinose transporter permease [Geobacillus thermodenitrificans]ARP42916.1 L-arabinose transport system permease protein AraQ [Geobacillus thermodenitrificans]ATO35822.1 arabinose transporter permease [Geobacillus thermodenitrificans]MEC5186852.1 arabinosaccharide transport system permease protein [Geobacillus thermodenitrific